MQIRLGYELTYNFPQPTPMILALSIHYSRASDVVIPDYVTTDPAVRIGGYRDGFGNLCTRLVAPGGRIRIKNRRARSGDTGQQDGIFPDAQQHPVQDICPKRDAALFLLGSRYCETDLLSQAAWDMFGMTTPGWASASRQFAIMCTTISPSTIRMREPPERRGKPSMSAPGSAAITPILRSHSVAPSISRRAIAPAISATSACRRPTELGDFAAWFEVYIGGAAWPHLRRPQQHPADRTSPAGARPRCVRRRNRNNLWPEYPGKLHRVDRARSTRKLFRYHEKQERIVNYVSPHCAPRHGI